MQVFKASPNGVLRAGWFVNLLTFFIFFSLMGCSPKSNRQEQPAKTQTDSAGIDSSFIDLTKIENAETENWDYRQLYGIYLHESNTKGFTVSVEVTHSGDDIQFNLSLSSASCGATASGFIGMAARMETEYIGFYDNKDCRLQFTFSTLENRLYIKEITLCTLHDLGCSFEGTYIKSD